MVWLWIAVGPAQSQCLPWDFTLAWCCSCGVPQVSTDPNARKAISSETRIDGWETYPREVLSLFTLRKEFNKAI